MSAISISFGEYDNKIGLPATSNCPLPLPVNTVRLLLLLHAAIKSGFPSSFISPAFILPGLQDIATGEPGAGSKTDWTEVCLSQNEKKENRTKTAIKGW